MQLKTNGKMFRRLVTSRMTSTNKLYSSFSDKAEVVHRTPKLSYYQQKNEQEVSVDSKPAGWDEAKSFWDIPGPKPLPLLGNMWRMVCGEFRGMDFVDILKK